MRLGLLSAVAISLLCVSALAQKRDHNEIIRVPNQDRAMAEAIAKAQATLDDFLATWKAQAPGTSEYRLKVQVKDGSLSEHFWVQPFRPTATGFEGVLANEPRIVRNVKGGQRIAFSRTDISDWGYVRDGKQVGSFTICAMFKHAPKEQVDYYQKNYGFDCKT
jgi:uncharacterized protein YegJ (DUF2314 family)